jgi:4-hydroxy-2-oxoglutarate aldolase
VSPSYFKKDLTDVALIRYYTDVAESLTIPVFAYNAPGFTGLTLSPNVIAKISRHPNIGGMKDTSPASMARYLEVRGDDFDILSGTINTLFIALVLGASGGVVSLANAFPNPCCELYQKWIEGDLDGARELHHKLFVLNQSVSGKSGVAGVKYASELGGYFGGDPRLPLLPMADEDKKSIRDAVAKAGLI